MHFRFDFIVSPPSSPSPFLFLLVCFSLSLSAALLIFHFIFAYCLQFAFAFCCWLFPFLIFCVRISLFTQNSFGCICLQLRGVCGGERRQLHVCVCVWLCDIFAWIIKASLKLKNFFNIYFFSNSSRLTCIRI